MRRFGAASLVLALAGFSMATQASARTVFGAQYTGVVQSGYDLTGLFGTPDANLAGDSYVETFTIDTGVNAPISTSKSETEFGGAMYGLAPSVTAAITINGHTLTVGGLYSGLARTGYDSADGLYEIADVATDESTTAAGAVDNFISGGIQTAKGGVVPTQFGGYKIAADGSTVKPYLSDFQFQTQSSNPADRIDTYGVLTVTSATPEPSVWALMMVGVGVTGAALRLGRRRDDTLAAIA